MLLGRPWGEVLAVETGEVRPPQVGEWFLQADGEAHLAGHNYSEGRPIVRLVEAKEQQR